MSKAENLQVSGVVDEINRAGAIVTLENGAKCTCTFCGKIRQNKIHIIRGDSVVVELSPYDLNHGRIVWRDM